MGVEEGTVEGEEVAGSVDGEGRDLVRFGEVVEAGEGGGELGFGGEALEAEFGIDVGGAFTVG